MNRLRAILCFLRLVDPHDSNLSLTSILLMVVIARLAIGGPGIEDLGALALALIQAMHKKHTSRAWTVTSKHTAELGAVANTVAALETGAVTLENRIGRVENRTAPAVRGFDQGGGR